MSCVYLYNDLFFPDVFYFKGNGLPTYPYENITYALEACDGIGAVLAPRTMLTEAYNKNLECCSCGHVSGKWIISLIK